MSEDDYEDTCIMVGVTNTDQELELLRIFIEYDQGKLPIFPGDPTALKAIANSKKTQVARDYAIKRIKAHYIPFSEHNRKMVEAEKAALKLPNDLLRTAYAIADREGVDTGWKVFKRNLSNELEREHKIIYPSVLKVDNRSKL